MDRPSTGRLDIEAAMRTLGIDRGASWAEVRRAYRARIRKVHPDVGGEADVATESAAALNLAWETVVRATDGGRHPLPAADATPSVPPVPPVPRSPAPVTLHAGSGDVFVRLLEAAYEVGDVSYIDPDAGLIQVLLDHGDPAASQLLIAIRSDDRPPSATFTLDTLGAEPAPDIHEVVARFARELEAQAW